ncbi:hypothetical protein J4G33_03955 [Actinotalea sp. BY-33]|uniref:Hemagglutinin n=1 Tax=Actinotalea soli TaxID=2819234 RepID=A0A939LN48_9CELL|nr:hypothetical protein [Actinotalea soli]MBO1750951.1 hypothetical protein [Actinotalea soli]
MRTRPVTRVVSLILTVAVAMVGAVAVVVAPPASAPAEAADLRLFDPGMIISDAAFYDASTMTAAQVQSFLVSKGSRCTSTSSLVCIKDFRQTTQNKPATAQCQGAYTGAANETAAQIIAKVARACGINPQVLLVTLQKEQGFITATAGKSAATYNKAMGFGCPDTAACNTEYAGFFNQVYRAAYQFKNYALNPNNFNHRAGMTNNVRFHPNAACGSSPVFIRNQATAGLYNYTPYQPNPAALAAGYGSGDSCSAYGNRNFWNYFTDWFGSTDQRQPIGTVDSVTSTAGSITVRGWALDPDTTASIRVHVYVDGKAVRSVLANGTRTDIGRIHGKGDQHGFSTSVPAADGRRNVCVHAMDATGGRVNPQIGCKTVTVANTRPIGSLDSVTASAGSATVRGWALDPDTDASIRVHVHVDGRAVRSVVANGNRPDVGRTYGRGNLHGYAVSVPVTDGRRTVCAFAIDSTGGPNRQLGCRTVTATNAAPIGSLDSVTTSIGGSLRLRGWALDPDTDDSIDVRITVDGTVMSTMTAAAARADVERVHGRGPLHGFTYEQDAAPGDYQVCAEALDATTKVARQLGCRTVTVNGAPFGHVDSVTGLTGEIRARGWAIDPNTNDPIRVHVHIDGSPARSVLANIRRDDVERAHQRGPLHGYDTRVPAAPGSRNVCLYGIDVQRERNTLLGCRTVTVT